MTIQVEMRMVCSCGKSTFQTLEKVNETFSITETFGSFGVFRAKEAFPNKMTLQCTTCGKKATLAL